MVVITSTVRFHNFYLTVGHIWVFEVFYSTVLSHYCISNKELITLTR